MAGTARQGQFQSTVRWLIVSRPSSQGAKWLQPSLVAKFTIQTLAKAYAVMRWPHVPRALV
jgi:hypothetical protein